MKILQNLFKIFENKIFSRVLILSEWWFSVCVQEEGSSGTKIESKVWWYS